MRIIIVGAGMGGLTAALGLLRQGHEVRIFEQAAAFGEVGAGITVSASAARGLDYLGVGTALEAAADPPEPVAIVHYHTLESIPGAERGDNVSAVPKGTLARRIHRADLHAILSQAVMEIDPGCVTLGARLESVGQDADSAWCDFAGGVTASGDAVIAADGLRSVARQSLFGEGWPRFTGQVAWRCLVPYERISEYLRYRKTSIFIGPNAFMTAYSVRQGTEISIAAMVRLDSWTEEGWKVPSSLDELRPHLGGWHPDIFAVFGEAPPGGLYKWALFDNEPMTSWARGRIALLGDAAHPMLPFLGAGASMAIEDAVVLSRAFERTRDVVDPLLRYQGARLERAATMLRVSRQQGDAFQGTDPNRYLKSNPPFRDATLFLYDPASVAV
jgi:salicylate hydroxylase